MNDVERGLAALFIEEELNRLDKLLTPREWDEVPIASRSHRLAFLSHLDAIEQSRILVLEATRHLDRLIAHAESRRRDVVLLISIYDWEDLHAPSPECVIPRFCISTHPDRDLVNFRLKPGRSAEASTLEAWLATGDLLRTHEVFDDLIEGPDPELRRVYVGQRASSRVAPYVVR